MASQVWDLNLYFFGKKADVMKNVCRGTCSYPVLLDKVNDIALSRVEAGVNLVISIKYADLLRGCEMQEIKSNSDVMEMFLKYEEESHINLYLCVDIVEPVACEQNTCSSSQAPKEPQNPSQFASPQSQVPEESSSNTDNDEPSIRSIENEESEEDVFGMSDEDEDWRAEDDNLEEEEIGDENESGVDSDMVAEESGDDIEVPEDALSDYGSGDDGAAPVSEDEFSDGGINGLHQVISGIPPRTDVRGRVVLEIYMVFESVQHFRKVVKDFAIENGFILKRVKNDNRRCTMVCKHDGCPWRIHSSVLADGKSFKVKTYRTVHNCPRVQFNPEANSTWMAKKLLESFRKNPTMKLSTLQNKLRKKFGIEVNCQQQLYRAKMKAVEMLEGSHSKSFEMLPTYGEQLFETNPGTHFILECDHSGLGRPQFQRVFVCLAGLRNGFVNGCRPFIGLDGCHLKGPYKGVLLSAVGLDANNGVYPIAVAIVESENSKSWEFFLKELAFTLQADHVNTHWTFMTHGQKGLDKVVQEIFPGADHRRCAWHLFNNFRNKFPGVMLAKYYWQAARAYTQSNFEIAMERIKEIDIEAYNWLMRLNAKHWSRHAFPLGLKCDAVTNNHTESFNGWLGDLREKPPIGTMDGVRKKMMQRTQQRYQKSLKWEGRISRNIKKKITKLCEEGRSCQIFSAGEGEFEVVDSGEVFNVFLGQNRCTCRKWQLSGIPCKHVCTAVSYARLDIENFVDKCYYISTFRRANGGWIIHPVDDPVHWRESTRPKPLPPSTRRPPGRPQNARRRNLNLESPATSNKSHLVTCKKCNNKGHNSRTCGRKRMREMTAAEKRAHRGSANTSQTQASQNASVNNGGGIQGGPAPVSQPQAGGSSSRVNMATNRNGAGGSGGAGMSSSQPNSASNTRTAAAGFGRTGVSNSQPNLANNRGGPGSSDSILSRLPRGSGTSPWSQF